MNRKKILLILPKLNRAGAQICALEIAKHIDKERYVIEACVMGAEAGALAGEFERNGVKISKINNRSILFPLYLYQYFRKSNIDIAHIHESPVFSVVLIPLARICGVKKIIYHLHSIWKYGYCKSAIVKVLTFLEDMMVDKYIAVSLAVKEFWVSEYRISQAKTEVIYNGVDSATFHPLSEKNKRAILGIPPEVPVIGNVGRLHPRKGHIFLLQAIPEILKMFPDCMFIIVGNGELGGGLKTRAKELGIDKSIIFMQARDDIPELLREFDIFVFPSPPGQAFRKGTVIEEGMPLAVLEAMATALPVAASDISGIPELIVDGGTGILFPPADPRAISRAIIELLTHKEKAVKMGVAARERIAQYFDIKKFAYSINLVYDQGNKDINGK